MSHDVEGRQKDLLNPSQRESLGQHLEQIKTLAPILICSMKIFIQILNQVRLIKFNRIELHVLLELHRLCKSEYVFKTERSNLLLICFKGSLH